MGAGPLASPAGDGHRDRGGGQFILPRAIVSRSAGDLRDAGRALQIRLDRRGTALGFPLLDLAGAARAFPRVSAGRKVSARDAVCADGIHLRTWQGATHRHLEAQRAGNGSRLSELRGLPCGHLAREAGGQTQHRARHGREYRRSPAVRAFPSPMRERRALHPESRPHRDRVDRRKASSGASSSSPMARCSPASSAPPAPCSPCGSAGSASTASGCATSSASSSCSASESSAAAPTCCPR